MGQRPRVKLRDQLLQESKLLGERFCKRICFLTGTVQPEAVFDTKRWDAGTFACAIHQTLSHGPPLFRPTLQSL